MPERITAATVALLEHGGWGNRSAPSPIRLGGPVVPAASFDEDNPLKYQWRRGESNRAGGDDVGAGSKCDGPLAVTGLPVRTSFSYHSVPQGQSNDLNS